MYPTNKRFSLWLSLLVIVFVFCALRNHASPDPGTAPARLGSCAGSHESPDRGPDSGSTNGDRAAIADADGYE
jgi:hypothetical protein